MKEENYIDLNDDDIIINTDHSDDDEIEKDIDEMYEMEVGEVNSEDKYELIHKFNTNKHKQEGKHRLPFDSILKGKKETNTDEVDDYFNNLLDVGVNVFEISSTSDDDYLEENQLNNDVYEVLNEKTNIDFTVNRRKPNRDVFNDYYNTLLLELNGKYSKSELFIELAYYFSDNVFNMYKLLNKKPALQILKELKQKGLIKNLNNFI